jgi:hypothetical protein
MKKDKKLEQAKQAAKRIVERSAAMGIVVAYSQALELVATDRGFETWHAFAADLHKPVPVVPKWKKTQGPMTNEQYLAHAQPNCCPVCGSTEIEGEYVSIEGRKAVQECGCNDCGTKWEDQYQLASYVLYENGLAVGSDENDESSSEAGPRYVIFSSVEDGYWSNETGWGSKAGATRFTAEQSRTMELPVIGNGDAQWVALTTGKPHTPATAIAYSIAVRDAAGDFLAMGTGFGPNRGEAQWEFANAKGLRPYHQLQFAVEDLARVRSDVSALLAWWKRHDAAEDSLDELVYEMVQQKGLPALNEASQADEQDELLNDADEQAASINNEGIEAQLKYLVAVCEPHVLLTKLAVDVGLQGLPDFA